MSALQKLYSIPGSNLVSTVCGHVFCGKCLPACVRINGNCPTCRKKIGYEDFHPLYLFWGEHFCGWIRVFLIMNLVVRRLMKQWLLNCQKYWLVNKVILKSLSFQTQEIKLIVDEGFRRRRSHRITLVSLVGSWCPAQAFSCLKPGTRHFLLV